MVRKVGSVEATGIASTTRSAPETAINAELASSSMAPIWRARLVVEGDLL